MKFHWLRFLPWSRFKGNTIRRVTPLLHRQALEHEKNFWRKKIKEPEFASMQAGWKNTAEHFEAIARNMVPLDDQSRILQIGQAVEDAITYWSVGRRFAADPLADFYAAELGFHDPSLGVIAAVAEFLPLAASCQDIVICLNVLDHVMNPGQVLKECRRVLRAGGLLFLGVEVYSQESVGRSADDPIHFHRFTIESIKELLKDHHFHLNKETAAPVPSSQDKNWF
jgi:SAM-dependent methyltransferase